MEAADQPEIHMTALHFLSAISFAFTAVFTYQAYTAEPGEGQSPRSAIAEAWAGIAIGFAINYVLNLLLFPLVGVRPSLLDTFLLGWIYTAASIVRQYVIRRYFNARLHNLALRLR